VSLTQFPIYHCCTLLQAERQARAAAEAADTADTAAKRLRTRCAEQTEALTAVERLLAEERDKRSRGERDAARSIAELRAAAAAAAEHEAAAEARESAAAAAASEHSRAAAAAASEAQRVIGTLRCEAQALEEALGTARAALQREAEPALRGCT
jgi:hypothetical protein